MRRRLQDIGLIEGTKVEMYTKSPSGDPIAFLIRGAVIALRTEDSSFRIDELIINVINEVRNMGWKRRRKSKRKNNRQNKILIKKVGKLLHWQATPM